MVAYTEYATDARPRRAAEALAGRGDHVDFLALNEPGAAQQEERSGVHLRRLPVRRYRGASVRDYVLSYASFFVRAVMAIGHRHWIRPYDVIYVHTMPDFMVFVGALAKAQGAKIVLDVHDTMPELYQSKFALPPESLLIRGLGLEERLSCAFADRVICVHHPHSELLGSRGIRREKIAVVLNTPDPDLFGPPVDPKQTPVPEGPPRLVYHGTVAERLGVDIALAAFDRVAKAFPEARFDIYGTGDDAARIEQLIDAWGLSGKVQFPNQAFRVDEIPGLLHNATLGLVGNRLDAATQHMLPVKLLEYVHLGIPALVPRLPVLRHYFSDHAVAFFEPGDVADMAAALHRMLADPQRRQALRSQAALFGKKYRWESMKEELFEAVDC